MSDIRRRLIAMFGTGPTVGPPIPPGPVSEDWFAKGTCLNCSATMTTAYCGACGQKAAQRFVWRDFGKEGWDRLRLFEVQLVRTLIRLAVAPGTVAREYVFGQRTAHMHPLKLLVAIVAVLVILLVANQYFGVYANGGDDAVVQRMAQQVLAFSNWSFSLGIVAIFAAAWIVFRGRHAYNAIELAVLAIYCQSVILALIIVNLLPTLIWRSPDFIVAHKDVSQHYIPVMKALIVTVAYRQFFDLRWRSDWPRLLLGCMLFSGINWILLRLYAAAILWLVSR